MDGGNRERTIEVEPEARSSVVDNADGTAALMQTMAVHSQDPSIVEVAIFDLVHHVDLAVSLVRAACDRQPHHQARLRQTSRVLP